VNRQLPLVLVQNRATADVSIRSWLLRDFCYAVVGIFCVLLQCISAAKVCKEQRKMMNRSRLASCRGGNALRYSKRLEKQGIER
jgi:hypothetical protein